MKLNRTKNAIKSIASGILNKVIVLILPFIVRTIFINTLGIEYLGLNSLFTSILNVLNLAELGIGSAITFSLYGAIASDDRKLICALENYYKKIYRILGSVILIIGIVMLPFITYFCNNDVPNGINIYYLYLLYLVNTTLSYFLFAYKKSLLQAHQKVYIINNVSTAVKVIMNILQIVFLLMGKDYYIYVCIIIIATILENIINAVIANKKYPNYIPEGKLTTQEKEKITEKIKALFFYKVGGVVLNSVDSIVISRYLGLAMLGKYNNYYYVITTLFGFLQIFTNAMVAGIGNSIATESVQKNYKDFNRLNFIQGWIVAWCSVCLLCLYQPFMKIWVGSENMFSIGIVISLTIYFYVWKMLDIINLFKEAAGLWEFDKYRPIIASIVNIVINIILVNSIGLYGIIISTIISIIIIIFPWSSYILFREYFKGKYKEYLSKWLKNLIITLFLAIPTYFFTNLINFNNDLLNLVLKGIVCIFIPNSIFVVANIRNYEFKESIEWLRDKFKVIKEKKE